jgi:hypothetical protein
LLAEFEGPEAWLGSGILPADLDESEKVDMADFAVLSGWWMSHCPADWPLKLAHQQIWHGLLDGVTCFL